jgi:hypothetical protein
MGSSTRPWGHWRGRPTKSLRFLRPEVKHYLGIVLCTPPVSSASMRVGRWKQKVSRLDKAVVAQS